MARPAKQGLDYYPLDVDFLQDIKVRRLLRAHGAQAIAVIINIYSQIYKDEGYYLAWSPDREFWTADELDLEEGEVAAVLSEALAVNLFDAAIFEQYGVLTSAGIQARFFGAAGRRKRVSYRDEFILIDLEPFPNAIIDDTNRVSANRNRVNVDINPENVDRNPTQAGTGRINVDRNKTTPTKDTEKAKLTPKSTAAQREENRVNVDRNRVNVYTNPVSAHINPENVYNNQQSKDKDKDKDKTHTLSDKSDREGESSHVEDKAPRKRKPTLQEQRFNLFWEEYPKKIGKQAALKRWLKLKPDPQLFDKIIQAVKEQRGSHQWTKDPKGEFIPGPARWLNEGRWDDVLPTASPGRPFQSRNTPVRDNRWWPSEDSREPGPDYEVPTLRVGKEKRADYDTRMPRLEEDTEPPEEDSP